MSERYEVEKMFAEMQVAIDKLEKSDKVRDSLRKGVSLKPIELKVFDPNERYHYLQFYAWSEQFSDMVITSSFTNAEKLLLLKNYTAGEPHKLIAMIVHSDGFGLAYESLVNTYGQSSNIIAESLKMLHELQAITSTGSSTALRTFYTKVVNALEILKHPGVSVYDNDLESNSIYNIICTRVPATLYIKWKEEQYNTLPDAGGGGEPLDPTVSVATLGGAHGNSGTTTLRDFLRFMDRFISNSESLSYMHLHRPKVAAGSMQKKNSKTHTITATSIKTSKSTTEHKNDKLGSTKCIFCSSTQHHSKKCDSKKSFKDKCNIPKNKKLCWPI